MKKYFPFLKFLIRSKRPFHLTKGGWIFILYSIGIGAGAINTGNNLLYLIFGLFLGLILASGVLSDLSLWGVVVDLDLPHKAMEKTSVHLPFRLTNNKKKFFSLSLKVKVLGMINKQAHEIEGFIPSLAAGETAHGQIVFQSPNRGVFEIHSVVIITAFPFNLLTKEFTAWTNKHNEKKQRQIHHKSHVSCHSILILPKPLPYEFTTNDFLDQAGSNQTNKEKKGEGTDFFGVRNFAPSDNPKRIHWKSSVKIPSLPGRYADSWRVKEMSVESKPSCILDWPSLADLDHMSDDLFENFVRFAAGAVQTYREFYSEVYLRIRVNDEIFLLSSDASATKESSIEFFLATVQRLPQKRDIRHQSMDSFFAGRFTQVHISLSDRFFLTHGGRSDHAA